MRWSLLVLVFIALLVSAQDKPEETLNAVVAVSARIQPNARSAETLGMQRSGTGALVREGYVLTIGYLVIEAEAIQVTGADGRTLPATLAAKPLSLGDSAALAEREPALAVTAPARDSPTLVYVVSRRAFTGSWEVRGRLFVGRVSPDGPAARAGLKSGDIVLAVGGEEVTTLADFYRRIWATGAAGAPARSVDRMDYFRASKTY